MGSEVLHPFLSMLLAKDFHIQGIRMKAGHPSQTPFRSSEWETPQSGLDTQSQQGMTLRHRSLSLAGSELAQILCPGCLGTSCSLRISLPPWGRETGLLGASQLSTQMHWVHRWNALKPPFLSGERTPIFYGEQSSGLCRETPEKKNLRSCLDLSGWCSPTESGCFLWPVLRAGWKRAWFKLLLDLLLCALWSIISKDLLVLLGHWDFLLIAARWSFPWMKFLPSSTACLALPGQGSPDALLVHIWCCASRSSGSEVSTGMSCGQTWH